MPKIPKCLKSKIWDLIIEELDKIRPEQNPSFREQELRKFAESLVEVA